MSAKRKVKSSKKAPKRKNAGLTSKNILDAINDQAASFKSQRAKWAFIKRIHDGVRKIIGIR